MRNSASIDRISNLSDDLLCHILSFLPTKLAFTTTVLSKRWTPLFKLLTSLHFEYESLGDEDSFLHFRRFVDTITLSTQLIKTFHLKCSSRRVHNDRFIETVKRHPVENLEIVSWFIAFPLSFFIFPTLVVLKLVKMLNMLGNGNTSVDLPSLKTLHLIKVSFNNKDNFINFLNGCPILEDLQTDQINYLGIFHYRDKQVRLKTLSKLIRAKINASDVPIEPISNVHFLQIKMLEMPLGSKINSYYRDFLLLQNLVHLQMSFNHKHHLDDVVEVLQNCPKLQILSITKLPFLHVQDIYRNWKNPNIVPMCISSHLISCTLIYKGFIGEIQFAKYILKHAPLLRVMKITFAASSSSQDTLKELNSCPRISSKCELSISFT